MLVKLKDIATITMGQSPDSKYYNSNKEGLPFLQGRTTFGRIYPYYDTWASQYNKIANSGDILMSVRAPVGDLNRCQICTAIGRGIAAINGNNIKFSVIGYGHGVGLSQTGADSMAKGGSNYKDIINHFYANVQIVSL